MDGRIIPAGPLCSYQFARGAVRESNSAQGEGGHEEKEEGRRGRGGRKKKIERTGRKPRVTSASKSAQLDKCRPTSWAMRATRGEQSATEEVKRA